MKNFFKKKVKDFWGGSVDRYHYLEKTMLFQHTGYSLKKKK